MSKGVHEPALGIVISFGTEVTGRIRVAAWQSPEGFQTVTAVDLGDRERDDSACAIALHGITGIIVMMIIMMFSVLRPLAWRWAAPA